MKYEFPKLYLLTDKNKIRTWEIWITYNNKVANIYTKYGLKDGIMTEPPSQIIEKSLNNQNPYLRAQKLAATRWNNQIQKGYTNKEPVIKPSYKRHDIDVPIMPMKAYLLDDNKVIYPTFIQPKLDGHRALLHKSNKGYEFLSNTQRPYKHLEHLHNELDNIELLKNKNIYLDGELYIDDKPVNILRGILSTIKLTEEKKKLSKSIKFYVFDIINLKNMKLNYTERYKILQNLFKIKFNNIVLTPTVIAKNKIELNKYFEKYIYEGYEGIIIRNMRGLYKLRGKSLDVLKYKYTKTDRFIIVGYKEGKGTDKDTVIWEIRCNNDPRKSFWAKPVGTKDERKKMLKEADNFIGKNIMVKYFEINKDGCVSKSPVAFFQ